MSGSYHPEHWSPWRPLDGPTEHGLLVWPASELMEDWLVLLREHRDLCRRMQSGETLWGDEARRAWELHDAAAAIEEYWEGHRG